MLRVQERAPGKVNLCLFLGPLRPDGRHELVTLFESVSLADDLVVEASANGADEVVCLGVEGPNLVTAALRGLRSRAWAAPPVRIEITKRIPVAAGMGGGSADAAALLRIAPRIAPVDDSEIAALAVELGADVPAQLAPGVALGTGAGEIVSRWEPLAPHAVVIVPSAHQLSTAAVYREADRLGLARHPDEIKALLRELEAGQRRRGRPPEATLVNDLEPAARSLCPAIVEALEAVRATDADTALVCGSGPTVAGLFWAEGSAQRASRAADQLAARFPGAMAVVPASSPACGTIPHR